MVEVIGEGLVFRPRTLLRILNLCSLSTAVNIHGWKPGRSTKFSPIRECEILTKQKVIDILVNNAGIMNYPKFELTVDGHEMTWQSNHLACGGVAFQWASKRPNHLWGIYPIQILHARALAHRLEQEGVYNVTVNSLHPGAVKTELQRHSGGITSVLFVPMKLFFKTPEEGAQTSIYLALSPDVEGVTAKYYNGSSLDSESSYASDDKAGQELYEYSLRTTGL